MTTAVLGSGPFIEIAESPDEMSAKLKKYGAHDSGSWKVVAGDTWILKGYGAFKHYTCSFLRKRLERQQEPVAGPAGRVGHVDRVGRAIRL